MKTVTTVRELRLATQSWRQHDEVIGFVPTMGALHDGHMSLVRKAESLSKRTVVSIFVNPLQFGATEDLSKYPRTLAADQEKLAAAGCDLLFTPTPEEMYPEGFVTRIEPGPMGDVLEGVHRPGHFTGVATVVTKLLMQVLPDYACFGEKDFQQLRIVEQLVRDLSIPTTIVPVPTVRDSHGLALSSRNSLLSTEGREQAMALPEALFDVAERLRSGQDVAMVLDAGRARLVEAGLRVDYFDLVDGRTLQSLGATKKGARVVVAARLGRVRLIDNVALFSAE